MPNVGYEVTKGVGKVLQELHVGAVIMLATI